MCETFSLLVKLKSEFQKSILVYRQTAELLKCYYSAYNVSFFTKEIKK